jgi:hypothetical protein
MKQRIQGLIMGMLIVAILFALQFSTNVLSAPRTVWRNLPVAFGEYKIIINGQPFNSIDHRGNSMEPFNYDGWIYAPIEHIAAVFGQTAFWDANTHTLHLSDSASHVPPVIQLPPTNTPMPAVAFLESDIFALSSDVSNQGTWRGFPQNGSFIIGNVTYHTGVTVTTRSGLSNNTIGEAVTLVYDISGRGYTKLTGVLGYTSISRNNNEASITVTCADSGRFIGGVGLIRNENPKNVDIDIPSNVSRISIRIYTQTSMQSFQAQVGFGNAAFR